MTVSKEEPGLWVGYCDSCGERVVLDTPEELEREDAITELEEEHGFRIEKDQKHRFKSDRLTYKEVYEQHFCSDC